VGGNVPSTSNFCLSWAVVWGSLGAVLILVIPIDDLLIPIQCLIRRPFKGETPDSPQVARYLHDVQDQGV